jgi:hypothetical protein
MYVSADGLGMSPPKARCVGSNPTRDATPLKHIQMCATLVKWRQMVQIHPMAPVRPIRLDSEAAVL